MKIYEVIVSVEAHEDFLGAVEWYEGQKQDLGIEFALKFDEALDLLEDNPHLCKLVAAEVRKMSMKKFPYAIYYDIDEELKEVGILAILHHKRGPEILEKRLKIK